jgi:predicted transcriptional regulator of viral defense system
MHKYLSKKEQEVWEYISDKEILDNETLKMIFPELSRDYRNKILHILHKKGYLKRATRDVYYHNLTNYHKLALRIYPGYIGLTSALKLYGLTEYEDFTIFIITKNKYKTINLKNYTLKYIPLKYYSGYIKKEDLIISSLEKTFFDCFLRIKYLNYSILTKALYDAKNIDWKEFLKFLEHAPITLNRKAGGILLMLKNETDFNVPQYVIKRLNPFKYNNKKKILSWWFQ